MRRLVLLFVLMTNTVQAKEHIVEMLNEYNGQMMRFSVSTLHVASRYSHLESHSQNP